MTKHFQVWWRAREREPSCGGYFLQCGVGGVLRGERVPGASFCCIDHDFFGNNVRPKLAVSYRIGSPHPGAITMVLRYLV